MPRITVGILTRNRKEAVQKAVQSALDQDVEDVEIVVVDNHSDDGTPEAIRARFPEVRLICLPRNLGCPGGRNHVFANSTSDYIVNLDDDGYLGEGALRRVIECFGADPSVGIVAMRRCCPGEDARLEAEETCAETSEFGGGVSAFSRNMLHEVGDYPEDFFLLGEEADLAIRAIDAGYKIVYHPGIVMWHPDPKVTGSGAGRWDYLRYRNSLLTVLRLFPLWLMLKYFLARIVSLGIYSLRRRTFHKYLAAVAAACCRLPGILASRKPCRAAAIRKYFKLRDVYYGRRSGGHAAPPRVALVQSGFSHYRRSLFLELCRQPPPAPQVWLYYGEHYEEIETVDHEDFLAADDPLCDRFRRMRNLWLTPKLVWQSTVLKLAVSRKFDVLIVEGNPHLLTNWIAAIVARLRGKRVLFWSHGFKRDEEGLKGWVRKQCYRFAHAMLLYANRSREICLKKGFRSDSLYVVLNSLDHEAQVGVRRQIKSADRREFRRRIFARPYLPLLLWVGRLLPSKRLDLLLQAAKHLANRGRDVNVLIVGDGPDEENLRALTQQLGLQGQVQFYGPCYEEQELGLLISSADLCVGPGAVGLSCLHSLAYGTPVVTHDDPNAHQGPEAEAIIPGETGDLFRRGDAGDLARVIHAWLKRPRSRDDIRAACYRRVDCEYNPRFQVGVFNAAVAGVPAEKTLPTSPAEADPRQMERAA